ncbi:hypothetical protein NL676_017030 [Syzygium grande]|nr:hypothetical protein NL676_017030 [Syzygium grande]
MSSSTTPPPSPTPWQELYVDRGTDQAPGCADWGVSRLQSPHHSLLQELDWYDAAGDQWRWYQRREKETTAVGDVTCWKRDQRELLGRRRAARVTRTAVRYERESWG